MDSALRQILAELEVSRREWVQLPYYMRANNPDGMSDNHRRLRKQLEREKRVERLVKRAPDND